MGQALPSSPAFLALADYDSADTAGFTRVKLGRGCLWLRVASA